MEFLWYIVVFFAAYQVYKYFNKQEIRNAEAYYWATVKEPFAVISMHPFDTDVEVKAAEIRAALVTYGNPYLDPENDVWVLPYRATTIEGRANENININFEQYTDIVLAEILTRREAWRARRIQFAGRDAANLFSNQTAAAA